MSTSSFPSIREAHARLTTKETTVQELVELFVRTAKEKNPALNAYIEFFNTDEYVARAQKKIDEGKAELLTGIPLAVKDNILIKGCVASSGSKMLEHYKATYDATVIEKLKAQGAVLLGRTNMDEFAMGASTESSYYGVTKNPFDPSRVPGGSSGGSAVSVAMGGAFAALGSDTGGSIRQPAGFCGLVGLKPTYGAVSRSGLMAMASSLDQIGPITRTVEDAEIIFNAIKGKDRLDSTGEEGAVVKNKKQCVIGVPRTFIEKGIDPDVLANFEESLKRLEKAGHTVKDISLPSFAYALPVYYIIVPAEVSANLARYDGVKYGFHASGKDLIDDYHKTRGQGFGKEVRRRVMLGTYVLSAGYYDAYYNKANAVRALIKDELTKVFEDVDAIAMPTSPTPAFKIGEKMNDPVSMYLSDIFTVSANVAGVPAISLPSGFVEREGRELPVGFQLLAPHWHEHTLFHLGKDFERVVQ